MLTSRSSWALAAKRSVSSASRPSVLTTSAPSKDSWAISLTSARSAWARVISGDGQPLVDEVGDDTAGKTSSPTSGQHDVGDEHLDDRDHHHRDRADRHRQRRDRPPGRLDVGVGVGEQLAGRVPLVPLHRQREVLPGDRAAVVGLHAVLHDAGAEAAGDDADRAQDRDAEEQREDRPEQAAVRSRRSRNAGSTTWSVAQPSTQASATVSAPKRRLPRWRGRRCRGSRLIATPSTAKPLARRRPAWLAPARPSPWCATPSGPSVPPDLRPSGYSTPPTPYQRDAGPLTRLRRMTRALLRPTRARRPLRPRPGARRGRPHAVRRLDRQGPGRPPAGARAQPAGGRRDRGPAAVRPDRARDGPAGAAPTSRCWSSGCAATA